jgi:hypothetical protein
MHCTKFDEKSRTAFMAIMCRCRSRSTASISEVPRFILASRRHL